MELRAKFEKVKGPEHDEAAMVAEARKVYEAGGEDYICVEQCRVKSEADIDSADVGVLARGQEVVVLGKCEIEVRLWGTV